MAEPSSQSVEGPDITNYWQYFQLDRDPFAMNAADELIYLSPHWEETLDLAQYLVHYKNQIIVINGNGGLGKTTFVDVLLDQLSETVNATKINAEPNLDVARLIEFLSDAFTLPWHPEQTIEQVLDEQLQAFQEKEHPCLLVIDNAQQLPTETLEALLYLVGQQSEHQMRFHVILVGEPIVQQTLQRLMEPAEEGLVHFLSMEPLSLAETQAYLNHRLMSSAWQGETPMSEEIVARIYRLSEGNPARINRIARRVLLDLLTQQQNDTDNGWWQRNGSKLVGAILIIVLLASVALWLTRSKPKTTEAPTSSAPTISINGQPLSTSLPTPAATQPVTSQPVPVPASNAPTASQNGAPAAVNNVVAASAPAVAPTPNGSAKVVNANVANQAPVNTVPAPAGSDVSPSSVAANTIEIRASGTAPAAINSTNGPSIAMPMSNNPTAAATTPAPTPVVAPAAAPTTNPANTPAVVPATLPVTAPAPQQAPSQPAAVSPASNPAPIMQPMQQTDEVSSTSVSTASTLQTVAGHNANVKPRHTVGGQLAPQASQPVENVAPTKTKKAEYLAVASSAKVTASTKAEKTKSAEDAVKAAAKPKCNYGLQLMGLSYTGSLDSFIKMNHLQGQITTRKVIQHGKPETVILYGCYKNADEAGQAVANLPVSLQSATPWPTKLQKDN